MKSLESHKSNIYFFLTLFMSFFLAVFIYKFFRLILTLPLLFLGMGLITSNKFYKKGFIKLISINLGLVFSIASLLFSSLNLFKSFSLTKKSETNKVRIISSGDYGKSGTWLKGKEADGLGYRYPSNLRNHTSKKVALKENNEVVVYDVIYNIDSLGNRNTPSPSDLTPDKNNSVLFLGDSFTFGEGLNDNETLSFYFQKLSKRASLNAGMHGYGAHQALMILFDESLFLKRTKGYNVTSIIYRPIVNHIKRAAGYSSWDSQGPCFEKDKNDNLKYLGSFINCKKRKSDSTFKAKLISRFANSKEPWTKDFFRKFTPDSNFSSRGYEKIDVDRFIAIVNKMREISESKGINFFVLLEDFNRSNGDSCGTFEVFSQNLKDKLISNKNNVIPTSDIYQKNICQKVPLTISQFDQHPSSNANSIIAEYFIRENIIE